MMNGSTLVNLVGVLIGKNLYEKSYCAVIIISSVTHIDIVMDGD